MFNQFVQTAPEKCVQIQAVKHSPLQTQRQQASHANRQLAHTVKKIIKPDMPGDETAVLDSHQPLGSRWISTGTMLKDSCVQLTAMKTVMNILTIEVARYMSSRVTRCGTLLQTAPIAGRGRVSLTPPQEQPHHQRLLGTRARSSCGKGGSPSSAKKYRVMLPTTAHYEKIAIKSSRTKAAEGRIMQTTHIEEMIGGVVIISRTSSR